MDGANTEADRKKMEKNNSIEIQMKSKETKKKKSP